MSSLRQGISRLGLLVLVAATLSAQERQPAEIFVDANTAFEESDYETAIRLYQELLASGAAAGRVRYNLGNAYLRNGELGRAIAEFRRSRSLLPRDQDVRANLAFARQSCKDAIAPSEPSPILSTLFFWHYRLAPREIAAVAVIVNLLFWGAAVLRLHRRRSELLRWLLIVLAVLLVGSGASLAAHRLVSRPVAVIVPPEITAHTAPDAESVVRFKLHAGSELRVLQQRDGWLRIVLPDGQQGWIEASQAELVVGSGHG